MLVVSEQERTDAVMDSVLGWVADRWSKEYSVTLSEAYAELLSSALYERLTDYSNYLYQTDPLKLYGLFQEELKAG